MFLIGWMLPIIFYPNLWNIKLVVLCGVVLVNTQLEFIVNDFPQSSHSKYINNNAVGRHFIKHQISVGYKYFVKSNHHHQGLEESILRILVKNSISIYMLTWLPILFSTCDSARVCRAKEISYRYPIDNDCVYQRYSKMIITIRKRI